MLWIGESEWELLRSNLHRIVRQLNRIEHKIDVHYAHRHVWLAVTVFANHKHKHRQRNLYLLHPYTETKIMTAVNVGHTVTYTYFIGDANGNPPPAGTPPIVPDAPATWSDVPATPPVDTFTVAPGGLSAVLVATAAGADTVNISVTVGGVTFTAADTVTISAAPFVPGSVVLVPNVT